jgi:hypothetical protein
MDEKIVVDVPESKWDKVKNKVKNVKVKVKNKARDVKTWATENKDEAVALAGMAIYGMVELGRVIKKLEPTAEEKKQKRIDTTYYDPSTGIHWRLRRKLDNDERMELVRRQRNGEYTEDILEDLGVLK